MDVLIVVSYELRFVNRCFLLTLELVLKVWGLGLVMSESFETSE